MGLGVVLGRHRDRHGSPRDPQNCLFGHPEIANFEWVWGSLWAGIGTATQPTHPPINLTAQLLKRGGGSARQRNWIEKSTAVFCASTSLPRRKSQTTKPPNDQATIQIGPAECAKRLNNMWGGWPSWGAPARNPGREPDQTPWGGGGAGRKGGSTGINVTEGKGNKPQNCAALSLVLLCFHCSYFT